MSLPAHRQRFQLLGDALQIHEEPLPSPAPDQVVVAITHVGRGPALPPGAELIGRVVGAGPLAEDWLGKRVVVPRLLPCGECDACRRGALALCPARLAPEGVVSHRLLPARFLLEPLDAEARSPGALLALIDVLATPYSGLARAGLQAGDVLVCIGDDARGRAIALLADHSAAKLSSAEDSATIPARRLIATTPQHAARALAAATPGSFVVLLDGAPTAPLTLPDLGGDDLSIVCQGAPHPDLLPELDALLASGALDASGLHEEVDLRTLLGAPPSERLVWAPLPTMAR